MDAFSPPLSSKGREGNTRIRRATPSVLVPTIGFSFTPFELDYRSLTPNSKGAQIYLLSYFFCNLKVGG